MFILTSYDIPSDRRRAKVAKILLDYGERVQYSVFECNLTLKQLQRLLTELQEVVSEEEDSIRVYRLCADCVEEIKVLGHAQPPTEDPEVYIV